MAFCGTPSPFSKSVPVKKRGAAVFRGSDGQIWHGFGDVFFHAQTQRQHFTVGSRSSGECRDIFFVQKTRRRIVLTGFKKTHAAFDLPCTVSGPHSEKSGDDEGQCEAKGPDTIPDGFDSIGQPARRFGSRDTPDLADAGTELAGQCLVHRLVHQAVFVDIGQFGQGRDILPCGAHVVPHERFFRVGIGQRPVAVMFRQRELGGRIAAAGGSHRQLQRPFRRFRRDFFPGEQDAGEPVLTFGVVFRRAFFQPAQGVFRPVCGFVVAGRYIHCRSITGLAGLYGTGCQTRKDGQDSGEAAEGKRHGAKRASGTDRIST
ncbi:hypothetical protein NB643_05470 [Oxalobacter aliiformigenes]|nr:hypothetical protein [Oxalobacter aliiformigenes]WAV94300.1 hypothetical protein NB643_05470 [Oxalobacter aliiformigenes]